MLGVAQGGLDVPVSEPLTDGGEGDPVVDELGGVRVAELVEGAGDPGGLAVLAPPGVDGVVAEGGQSPFFSTRNRGPC